jgi:hypothetical protein
MTRAYALTLSLLLSCAACKMEPEDEQQQDGSSNAGGGGQSMQSGGGQGGSPSGGSGGSIASGEGTTGGGGGSSGAEAGSGGLGGSGSGVDGGIGVVDPGQLPDAGPFMGDAAVGAIGAGSCCSEHDTPGCSNADLQVCVCEMVPQCCTESWGAPCVLFVTQKYCQPGVRECVCGDGQGQWGQSSCCDLEWADFCDSVAETKCDAVPGCM